jgi:hypothetical protein
MIENNFTGQITNNTSMDFSSGGLEWAHYTIILIFLFFLIPYLFELFLSYRNVHNRNKIISKIFENIPFSPHYYVSTEKGFHFDGPDKNTHVAHNLIEFQRLLNELPQNNTLPYLQNGNYTEWIKTTMHMDDLANAIEKLKKSTDLTELKTIVKKWIEENDSAHASVAASIEVIRQPVEGISGFTRGMIALGIIFVLGISIILIFIAKNGDSQLATNTLSMMETSLAAVVGFYFGGKAAQTPK